MNSQPVYKDPDETMRECRIPKSQSCPILFMDDDDEEEERVEPNVRARAFSVCVTSKQKRTRSISTVTLNRTQSDSNLSNIDKEKTFATGLQRTGVLPAELLAKVVAALGGYRVANEDEQRLASSNHSSAMGIQGFYDSEILASEQPNYYSDWSIGPSERSFATLPPQRLNPRHRAKSEVRIPMEDFVKASTEWTWSGANTQIKEIEKMRSKAARPKENLYKASLQPKMRYDAEAVVDEYSQDLPMKSNETIANKNLLSKLNPFHFKLPNMMKRHSLAPGTEMDPHQYIRSTQKGRDSVNSLSKNYLTQHRPSMFAMPGFQEEKDLLETTTIADLIRAIEQVHTDEVVLSASQEMLNAKKQRKLGTDYLSQSRRPSLFTLEAKQNSSQTVHGASDIRPSKATTGRTRFNSNVSTPGENADYDRGRILGDANPFTRHPSIYPPPPYTTAPVELALKPALKRRFSVRPSNLDKAPGQFHTPQNSQITAIPPQQASPVLAFQRKLSWRPTPSSLVHPSELKKLGRQKTESTSSTNPS